MAHDPPTRGLEVALGIEARLRELRAQLAERPDPGGSAEVEIHALLEERDAAVREIGLGVLKWALAGGQVVLEEVADEAPAMADDTDPAAPLEEVAEVVAAEDHEEPPIPEPPIDEETVEPAAAPEAEVDVPALAAAPVAESRDPTPRPAPAATMDDLLRLAGGLGPKWNGASAGDAVDRLAPLLKALDEIAAPTEVSSQGSYAHQVLHVRAAADGMDGWLALDQEVQRELLALAVAKARYLQDEADPAFAREPDLDALARTFKAFTRFSGDHQPGYVYGLTRKHQPTPARTWLASARYWWDRLSGRAGTTGVEAPRREAVAPEVLLDRLRRSISRGARPATLARAFLRAIQGGVAPDDPRLVGLAADHADVLQVEPELKGLRRAVRNAMNADGAEPENGQEVALPSDWPWRRVTADAVAVVVGGDSRPEAAARIQRAFGFNDVEWDSDAQGRRLDGLTSRIRNKSVGMVIFLARYGSHRAQKALRDACKEGGVPFVRLDRGYGVEEVRREIEASVAAG